MTELERELRKTAMIHFPLPLHEERSLETEGARKKVLKERKLPCEAENWQAAGECDVTAADGVLRISAPLCYDRRPHGDLELGDCSNFGHFGARGRVDRENWEEYNRFSFNLKVDALGERKICVRLCLHNDGVHKLPDRYNRDGFHSINMPCGKTQRIALEIPSTPRDCITGYDLMFYAGGCETEASLGNLLTAEADDFRLEQVENAEIAIGWRPAENRIVYCFSGYRPASEKVALICGHEGETFRLEDENGKVVYSGKAEATGFHDLSRLDFTAWREPGSYRLSVCGMTTSVFPIGEDIWMASAWKVINFLFCERCGYPVPGVHQTCHRDVIAKHDGKSFVFHGGWHDAGDLSQQLIQTAEVTASLFELADALPETQDALKARVREEALWGLDYVLGSRFGDGFRATSVGTALWSQGFAGDADDITARMHDNAYENYLCAAIEAFCAGHLKEEDPQLAAIVMNCAAADYRFAKERFAKTGFSERPPIYWEHSWMTSECAFSATMALAAALLYEATGKAEYSEDASGHLRYVLSCQQQEAAGPLFPEGGFFYRNPERKAIVHFSHQARDQIFARTLTTALRAMPDAPDAPAWQNALERHADYLRSLMKLASPYGMIPAGLYRLEEREDAESFKRQHLETGSETWEHYAKQLEAGVAVGDGYYMRHFPVWFSFKGNNAVILSMAKAASICGKALNDPALVLAAERQLFWNIGVNPFCQSLMYGEGERYAQQYAAMSGESVGEIPVGIQTLDDEDAPFWPQMNNATYKEVWTTPAGRWMAILADLF